MESFFPLWLITTGKALQGASPRGGFSRRKRIVTPQHEGRALRGLLLHDASVTLSPPHPLLLPHRHRRQQALLIGPTQRLLRALAGERRRSARHPDRTGRSAGAEDRGPD